MAEDALFRRVELAAKLRDTRDLYRRLWRDVWPAPVEETMAFLRAAMEAHGVKNPLEMAHRVAARAEADGQATLAVLVIVAAVEIVDPTPAGWAEGRP